MAYGLQYICEFDNLSVTVPVAPVFTLEFHFKNYTGPVNSLKGSAVPVVHSWDTDDPHAAIKGSSLDISLINEGQTPLISFMTIEDDGVKVRLLWGTQLMFEGYLVQDDCSELMVEHNHEIKLTANDNLGLLKGVALNHNALLNNVSAGIQIQASEGNIQFQDSPFIPEVGVPFEILNHPTLNGIYTPTDIQSYTIGTSTYYSAGFATESLPDEPYAAGDVRMAELILNSKIPLLLVVQYCLANTNIFLPVNFYANIHESLSPQDMVFLKDTLIDPYSFLKSDNEYEDAYTVLEKILKRFNLTLFQSLGIWNFVRWDELPFYSNSINGYSYDPDFNYIGTTTLAAPINFGTSVLLWEYAPIHKMFRPYLYVKETFNYRQPTRFLRNFDLQEIGTLRTQYTTGSGVDLLTFKEYDAKWWYDNPLNPAASTYFIRVTYDYLLNEVDRYMVVMNDDIISYPMEVAQGDAFTYSFALITLASHPGNINHSFKIELTNGTTTVFLRQDGTWTGGPGYLFNIPSGDNSNVSHTVEILGANIPFDGLLYVFLEDFGLGGDETHYTDIRMDYTPLISKSTKIIGHYHRSAQGGNIKANDEEEIFIDSSPRNSVAGTLFRSTLTGLLQDRTLQWSMPGLTPHNLGEVTTSETLTWRRYPRHIFEGNVIGEAGLPQYVSMLNTLIYIGYPDLSLTWGKLEINYRENEMTGTLWEMWRTGETALGYNYDFKYLYALK